MKNNTRPRKYKLIFGLTVIVIIGSLMLFVILTGFGEHTEKTENRSELRADAITVKPEINTTLLEQEIHQLVNEARVENGVRPLDWDETISTIAREHSIDMMERNYFGHESPEGNRSKDRGFEFGYKFCGDENIVKRFQDFDVDNTEFQEHIKNLGITDEQHLSFYPELWNKFMELEKTKNELRELSQSGSYGLAENLYKASLHKSKIVLDNKTIGYFWKTFDELSETAIESWLNSSSHRETMLQDYWNVEGIGAALDGDQWLIVTQNFC